MLVPACFKCNSSFSSIQFSSVAQACSTLRSHRFQTHQASLSMTNTQSLPKLISIELVMPFDHLILCHPPLLSPSVFPNIRVFSNELVLCIRWPSIGVTASALVLPMNIQDWFPLELTSLISLQSKGLSRVLSNTTIQKHQLFGAQPSLWSSSYICMW